MHRALLYQLTAAVCLALCLIPPIALRDAPAFDVGPAAGMPAAAAPVAEVAAAPVADVASAPAQGSTTASVAVAITSASDSASNADAGDAAANTSVSDSAPSPGVAATDAAASATATDAVASTTATDAVPSTSTGAQIQTDPALNVATVVEHHLPAWVQVAVSSSSLYAADTGTDQLQSRLSRNTYLRVLAGGADRLQVQVYDLQSGTPGQTGWVEADQVLPSAPGTGWLVSATPTTLWSAADPSASQVRALDRFTPLLQVDGPVQGRLLVNVYRADFSGILAQGWVNLVDTGPALAPALHLAAPADPALTQRAASSPTQQTDFLTAAAQAARPAAAATGVPASVTVAQAILESDWGRSTLAQAANNFFGMKAMGTLGNDGVVWMPTSEYNAAGQLYQTTSAFRAYKSLADSMQDHDLLLERATRYAAAMQSASDPKQFAQLIAQEGYSTDPAYADKLIALMDHYNLYQLDS